MGLQADQDKSFENVTNLWHCRGKGPLATRSSIDRIVQIPCCAVVSSHLSLACTSRLTGQLQLLSRVVESLTYRLIELEERFGSYEQLDRLSSQGPSPGEELMALTMEERLGDTEDRLGRIEARLRGFQPGMDAVASGSEATQVDGCRQEMIIDTASLFPEEGEQPFMDELLAS